jgi:hypothetical protein
LSASANSPESTPALTAVAGAASPVARGFAVLGLVWQSTLLYGAARCVFLMIGTFLEITRSGSSDPRIMADGVAQALVPVIFWGAVGVFGLLVTLLTAIASRYRARWFFWSSATFAVLYLLFLPVGTVISIALIVFLIAKRKEFAKPASVPSVA